MLDWSKVHHNHFEKFIYYYLSKIGYRNREWFGRGGSDKGRDIVAYTYEELPFNLGYERKWVFQAKRWKKLPGTTTLINEINTAKQHAPDFWVLVVPVDLTANQIDYFAFLNNSFEFKIIVVPLAALEEILHAFPETKNILLYGNLNKGGIK